MMVCCHIQAHMAYLFVDMMASCVHQFFGLKMVCLGCSTWKKHTGSGIWRTPLLQEVTGMLQAHSKSCFASVVDDNSASEALLVTKLGWLDVGIMLHVERQSGAHENGFLRNYNFHRHYTIVHFSTNNAGNPHYI